MSKYKCCPKCGEDISETYEPANKATGNECGAWYCDACEQIVINEDDDEEDEK